MGAGFVYSLNNPTWILAIPFFATNGLWLLGIGVSYIGRRRPVGSRFSLTFGVFQPIQHPYRPMNGRDAEREWALLGQPSNALLGGWECPEHCSQQFFVGENAGKRYYVFGNVNPEPWASWSVGYMLVAGKDAPLSAVPVRA
jgi:hypothetical protein